MANILFIDNFDSFTFNLVDEFAKRGCKVQVYRNDISSAKMKEVVREFKPLLIVISPGPGTPRNSGNILKIIGEYYKSVPIFGVCLGHQAIIEAFGGKVSKCEETIHGKHSSIMHDGKTIFLGVENPLSAGRYHSLSGHNIPACLEITARTEKGIVMGVRHRKYLVEGIQFHPESVLTPEGGKIIENIIRLAENNVQVKLE